VQSPDEPTSLGIALIVSTDAMIGALLGVYAEAAGYRAAFDDGDRSPADAVGRYRPTVILVDVDHRDGFSPAFIRRQQEAGIPVIAFSPRRERHEVEQRARAFGLPSFALPIELSGFRGVLERSVGGAG
jgi:DNA-binding response OmpR family regulator